MGQDYSITGQASPPDTTGNSSTTGNNLICDGSHWQYPALIAGNIGAGGTAASCATGTAGAIQWTGSALQYCNGTSWTAIGGGGSSAFSSITTGTNTTATMTVGTGGSLTFSGSGTVNASTLGGATFAAPGAIGGTTAGTSAFTTVAASGAITDTRAPAANTSIDGIILTDTTAASSGNQQWSPRVHFTGQGWKTTATAASQAVDMIQELQPVQGTTNPTGNLTWSSSVNGGAYSALMTLTSAGNVGIGTASPGYSLHIYGAGNITPTVQSSNSNTAAWRYVSGSDTYQVGGQVGGISGFGILDETASSAVRLEILNNGNVGIGTTSPGYALQVVGDIIASKSIAFNAVSSIPSNAGFYAPTTNAIGFVTNGAEAMRIISTGNVGIGTTSPDAVPLTVTGTGNYGIVHIIGPAASGTGGEADISFQGNGVGNGGTGDWLLGVNIGTANGNFSVFQAGASNNVLNITTGGLVGIGTTSPNTNLDLGTGYFEWGGESRVTSTFSKTNSTALAAITGLSATLVAGKTYEFTLKLYTTSSTSGGTKVDFGGGSATATSFIAHSIEVNDSNTYEESSRLSSLTNTGCAITAISNGFCQISGTITVSAGGTFIPRFAQNASNGTASTVAVGSNMIVHQIN